MSIRCNSRFSTSAGLLSRLRLSARLAPFMLVAAAATMANCGEGISDPDIASTQGALSTSIGSTPWPSLSPAWTQQSRLTADSPLEGSAFGTAVAISGNTMVVGAAGPLADYAYIFGRSGSTWTQLARLDHPEAPSAGQFGRAVAISEDGNTIAVGAPYWHKPYDTYGAVYIYVRSGSTFSQQQILLPPSDVTPSFGSFGITVALSRDTLVVGDPYSRPLGVEGAGATHVYVRSGTTWTRQARLLAADRTTSGFFGGSVAVFADTLLVASGSNTIGGVYVFTRSGSAWTQRTKLVPPGLSNPGIAAVALSGQTAVAGTYDPNGGAYVYVGSGASWRQQAKLIGSDTVSRDNFSWSVAISGNTVAVGAQNAQPAGLTGAGAAYLFTRSGTTWTQKAKLISSEIEPEHDQFGASVAVSGSTAAVGASHAEPDDIMGAGAAFVFTP